MNDNHHVDALNRIFTQWNKFKSEKKLEEALVFLTSEKTQFSSDSDADVRIRSFITSFVGHTYSKMGMHDAAVNSFEEAYALVGDDLYIFHKAMSLWDMGKIEESDETIDSIENDYTLAKAKQWKKRRR